MGYLYFLCPTCRLRRLTVWSLIYYHYYFTYFRELCVDFSGSFYLSFIFLDMYPFRVVSLRPRKAFASVGPVLMLEGTEQRSERFLM